MWKSIMDLLTSKKFKVAFFTLLALVCGVMTDKIPLAEAIKLGLPVILVYLGAQGMADFGKAAKEFENDKSA